VTAGSWRQVDWPRVVQRRRVNGRDLVFVDLGEDRDVPALLLIHGLGGQWQNWLDNINPLSAHRRVIALDLPGFGYSAPLADPTLISGYADAAIALCDALGVAHVVPVGSSFGGIVAVDLASRHADRVDRVALVDAAGITLTRRERLAALGALRLVATAVMPLRRAHRAIAQRPRLRRWALWLALDDAAALPADLVYQALFGPPGPSFAAVLGAGVGCLGPSWDERLRQLTRPALVVWGARDRLLPLRHAHEFVKLIPDAQLVVIDAAGHAPMLERPVVFNAALLAFLG